MKSPTPCTTGVNEFKVVVEGIDILRTTTKSFDMVLQAWFATFWVFSIAYPDGLKNSCEFFEKVLLGRGAGRFQLVSANGATGLV
jgi:hypothetical protein